MTWVIQQKAGAALKRSASPPPPPPLLPPLQSPFMTSCLNQNQRRASAAAARPVVRAAAAADRSGSGSGGAQRRERPRPRQTPHQDEQQQRQQAKPRQQRSDSQQPRGRRDGPESAAAAPEMRKNPALYGALADAGAGSSGAGSSSGARSRAAPPSGPVGTTGSYSAPLSGGTQAAAAQAPARPAAAKQQQHEQPIRLPAAKPEVLAPVGGWPQLRAAVENGADAVYFGLTDFSARGEWQGRGGWRGVEQERLGGRKGEGQEKAAARSKSCGGGGSGGGGTAHHHQRQRHQPTALSLPHCRPRPPPPAARAANFTPEELPEVMSYLRARGVKGYVALNVLIFDEELPALEARARQIAAAGVDAVIVQDVGAVALLRRAAPALPVHGSTQMRCCARGW